MSHLAAVTLPAFGSEELVPAIPPAVYRRRLDLATARMDAAGLDVLAVYGDREHFANLMFLTGFDPRFEEALLLLARDGRRLLLAGNECFGFLPDEAVGVPAELFQEFSLPGQPRGGSRPLRVILESFGVRAGAQVGCAGWKRLTPALAGGDAGTLEIPSYLADTLRALAGDRGRVVNANDLFTGPADGLRLAAEPEQIAAFEFAATRTSDGILALLRQLRPGVRENALEPLLDARGLPLTCHRMVSFGAKARRGLASPSDNVARLGDPCTTAFGIVGALTARAGCLARGPQDLPPDLRDFYDAFASNYFDVVAAWYGALRVGATAGAVYAAAEARRDDRLWRFALNPGHYLHLDEWMHSPFAAGSPVPLRSGLALQADIIPVSTGPFCCSNVEDGVVLADAALRARLQQDYPACWDRIGKRRAFMRDVLHVPLDESVLPLGNTPAWLPPYLLDLSQALVA
jgi:hypothetical protein